MKLLTLTAIFTAVTSAYPSTRVDEYEYVIVGSGPGGGTLAYVICSTSNFGAGSH